MATARQTTALDYLFWVVIAVALVGRPAAGDDRADRKETFELPAEVPAPADNLATPARAALGKMLFFDPRLSGSNTMSCARCHNPSLGWSDGLPVAIGEGMHDLQRSTPSIVNSGFNKFLMWDGRFSTLEEQAWTPMLATTEMHGTQEQILVKLRALPGYVSAFEEAYAGEGITRESVGKALANFERTIVSRDSPFDRWVRGDESAMNDSAKSGFALFTGKAQCSLCHSGGNFSDQGFHNLGLAGNQDQGRYLKVPVQAMKGAFKTPTLRDVALTPPYMHNGMYRTLREVIDHYDRGGDGGPNTDPNIKPLGLSEQEKLDLVEFLRSLTGKQTALTVPRLPQ
jgi:cytochrome c peroxidase